MRRSYRFSRSVYCLVGGEAGGFGQAEFAAHDVGALHQRDHLEEGVAAAHALASHAAIGCDHQPLGRDVLERAADESATSSGVSTCSV